MELYNNTVCFPANQYFHEYSDAPGKGDVVKENYVAYGTYCSQIDRDIIKIVRQGKGEGSYALIDFESIPRKYKEQIKKDYDNPQLAAAEQTFINRISKDEKAFVFFANYRYPDGTGLNNGSTDNITMWGNSASVLNAIRDEYRDHVAERAKLGKKPLKTVFFINVAAKLRFDAVQKQYPNNLPTNGRRLQTKFDNYLKNSYSSLIKNYKGNENSVKINDKLLKLLVFIASMPTRPYNTKVVEYYLEFMQGKREFYDKNTGEVFDPADYLDKDGKIIEFTETAVWQRLNQPGIQVVVDKKRYGHKDYNDIHRPHRHRRTPKYASSKISLDDRDLIWKDKDTKKRVKAYYAYDVASGCRVGSAYSDDKNEELFLDCLRDMFVFCDRNGFGMPLEVEVENHLVNKFFDDLQRMFPILTICAPGNSQEKRAEHFNRSVKYSVEKNNHPGGGRWWLKSKYNRIGVDKVDDEFKQTFKQRDRLIIDDIQDTLEYNNAKHPNQKKFPGMTRMDVLKKYINPNLQQLNKALIYRYIGFETKETTINRNQWFWCQDEKYILPSPRVLELLDPNNRTVTTYWMPDSEGSINEVYMYQNGEYICTCEKLVEYNEAKAERTELDDAAKLKQDKYVSMYDKMVKDGLSDFAAIEMLPISHTPELEPVIVNEKQPEPTKAQAAEIDYAQKAVSDFF